MRDTASAPAPSTAWAIAVMSVTLGDSFTITGTAECFLATSVTSAASSGTGAVGQAARLHVGTGDVDLDHIHPSGGRASRT